MMSGKVRRGGDACLDHDEGGAAKRPAAGGAGAERPSKDDAGGAGAGGAAVGDDASPLLRMLCVGGAREALFSLLSTKDAAALRAVSPRLREEVAQHPWDGAPLSRGKRTPRDFRVRHSLKG